jgi:hypothetical protein
MQALLGSASVNRAVVLVEMQFLRHAQATHGKKLYQGDGTRNISASFSINCPIDRTIGLLLLFVCDNDLAYEQVPSDLCGVA